jgi:hypothetical protein
MEQVSPRFDGYFQSERQRREEWHAGVHMVEEYFDYLKLFDDGRWLLKTQPTPEFDFAGYLVAETEEAFRNGLAARDPQDADLDFVHQTGRFTFSADQVELVHRQFLIVMNEARWTLRVETPERLRSQFGAVYHFRPAVVG